MLTKSQEVVQFLRVGTTWGKPRAGYLYKSHYDLILREGKDYGGVPFTHEELMELQPLLQTAARLRPQTRECYYNAFRMADLAEALRLDVRYAEGVAAGIIPVNHGFNVYKGKPFDVTWQTLEDVKKFRRFTMKAETTTGGFMTRAKAAPAPEAEVITQEGMIDQVIAETEKRSKFVETIVSRSLVHLKPGDVIAVEGAPYITIGGAMKIARVFGVKTSCGGRPPTKTQGEDARGKYYLYTHVVTASLPNGADSVEEIGTCSSRDKFFGYAHNEWKPQEDVDEANILLTSATVAERRAIVRLLGLEHLTWDDLAKYGIKQSEVSSFSFRKPATTSRAPATPARAPSVQSGAPPVAEPPAAAPGKPSGPDEAPPTTSPLDYENVRQTALNHLKQLSALTKKPLAQTIKDMSGGKQSLGQLTDDECEELIVHCIKAIGDQNGK